MRLEVFGLISDFLFKNFQQKVLSKDYLYSKADQLHFSFLADFERFGLHTHVWDSIDLLKHIILQINELDDGFIIPIVTDCLL